MLYGHGKNFEGHRLQIAHHIGGWLPHPADRTRIHHPGFSATDVVHLLNRGAMIVAATDHVPFTGTGQSAGVMRVMHDENRAAMQGDTRILAVKMDQVARLVRHARQGIEIAGVVAVDDVYRHIQLLEHTQGISRDNVTAMQRGNGAARLGVLHGRSQQCAIVVTIGKNTNLHRLWGIGKRQEPELTRPRSIWLT